MKTENIELVHYVKDPRTKQPRGVVVARKLNDKQFGIGWAYANTRAGDRFDKDRGRLIALNRCSVGTRSVIPCDLQKSVDTMYLRARRYFKDMGLFDNGIL